MVNNIKNPIDFELHMNQTEHHGATQTSCEIPKSFTESNKLRTPQILVKVVLPNELHLHNVASSREQTKRKPITDTDRKTANINLPPAKKQRSPDYETSVDLWSDTIAMA